MAVGLAAQLMSFRRSSFLSLLLLFENRLAVRVKLLHKCNFPFDVRFHYIYGHHFFNAASFQIMGYFFEWLDPVGLYFLFIWGDWVCPFGRVNLLFVSCLILTMWGWGVVVHHFKGVRVVVASIKTNKVREERKRERGCWRVHFRTNVIMCSHEPAVECVAFLYCPFLFYC